MKSSIYNELQHYLIEHACLWIFLTLICVNWIRTENKKKQWEREVGGDGVCGCSFGEQLKRQETFQSSLYIQTRAWKQFRSVHLKEYDYHWLKVWGL